MPFWHQLHALIPMVAVTTTHRQSHSKKETIYGRTVVRRLHQHTHHCNGVELFLFVLGKLRVLERLLPRLKAGGHRVLMFSQSTMFLDVVQVQGLGLVGLGFHVYGT